MDNYFFKMAGLAYIGMDLEKFISGVNEFVQQPNPRTAQDAYISAILPHHAILDAAREGEGDLAAHCWKFLINASIFYKSLLTHSEEAEIYMLRAHRILKRGYEVAQVLCYLPRVDLRHRIP